MIVVEQIAAARERVAEARREGRRVGLVPTMGALHAGHLSLVEASRKNGDFVIVSVFVNPTQFGPNEDYAAYPQDRAADLRACRDAGVSLVFCPTAEEMYPNGDATVVHVSGLTDSLCGPHRPGHFDGVATVVAKLFAIIQPDAAYFGQKDAQQLAVIRQLTRDLMLPVEIVGCPIIREPDGLAMSSRNRYLTDAQRVQARSLYGALCAARDEIACGQRRAAAVRERMKGVISAAGCCTIDYADVVDPQTVQPLRVVDRRVLLAVAVRIGEARLIDNMLVDPPGRGS